MALCCVTPRAVQAGAVGRTAGPVTPTLPPVRAGVRLRARVRRPVLLVAATRPKVADAAAAVDARRPSAASSVAATTAVNPASARPCPGAGRLAAVASVAAARRVVGEVDPIKRKASPELKVLKVGKWQLPLGVQGRPHPVGHLREPKHDYTPGPQNALVGYVDEVVSSALWRPVKEPLFVELDYQPQRPPLWIEP